MKSIHGFTLIELLVVITVIGILVGVLLVVINPSEQLKKTKDAQRMHDLSQIQKALELYYNDNGKYPPSDASTGFISGVSWGGTWPGYMEVVPQDPSSGKSYSYSITRNGGYVLSALLDRCPDSQATCDPYRVTSPNVASAGDSGGSGVIVPSATPTSPPVPSTNTPTPTSTPTSTPTPTLFPIKRVFVSKTWKDGNIGGVSAADTFCTTQANQNNLGGAWAAWLSDSSNGAASRLNPSGNQYRYRLVDGTTIIANSWTDLTDGTLQHVINKDQFGDASGSTGILIWTNTKPDGTSDGSGANNTCANWSQNNFNKYGEIGHDAYVDSQWTQYTAEGNKSCDGYRALYCFEK